MAANDALSGISSCYMFKSQLQEHAQKVGLPTPEYDVKKEGPSHDPSFSSSVTLNGVKYESLLGFCNRKAAEQSAAEVALVELAKSREANPDISQPAHETGLCKNMLQEYAQRMKYEMPNYGCQQEEPSGRGTMFKCTVEIGGIQYVGASARTKREAEIKAASTALLAIQSSTSGLSLCDSQLRVVSQKKRAAETISAPEENKNVCKAKKARSKKKKKKKLSSDSENQTEGEITVNGQSRSESDQSDSSAVQGIGCGTSVVEAMANFHDGKVNADMSGTEANDVSITGNFEGQESLARDFYEGNHGIPAAGISAELNRDANIVNGVGDVDSVANNST